MKINTEHIIIVIDNCNNSKGIIIYVATQFRSGTLIIPNMLVHCLFIETASYFIDRCFLTTSYIGRYLFEARFNCLKTSGLLRPAACLAGFNTCSVVSAFILTL